MIWFKDLKMPSYYFVDENIGDGNNERSLNDKTGDDGKLSEKQRSLQILGDVLGSTKIKHPQSKKIFK